MRKIGVFAVLSLLLSCQLGADEADVVFEGSLRHQRNLSGLQFHIRSSRWLEGDYAAFVANDPDAELNFSYAQPVDFLETFAIRYDPRDIEIPWRIRWVCEDRDPPPEEWLSPRAFFVVSDKNLHSMIRPDYRLVDKKQFTAHEDYFQALTAGAIVHSRGVMTVNFRWYDLVGNALLMNARLHSAYVDVDGSASRQVPGWVISERSTFLGKNSVRLKFNSSNPNEMATVEVLDKPHYAVVRYEATLRTSKGTFPVMTLETTKLSEFNGVIFPAAGTVTEELADLAGVIFRNASKFEITHVEKIPASVLKNWVPELPQGTSVNDHNRISQIPFSDEVRQAKIFSMVQAEAKGDTTAPPRYVLYVVVLLVAVIPLLLAKRYARYRNAS